MNVMNRSERVAAAQARLAGKIGTIEVTFTTTEVAAMVGVDRKTVGRWVKDGTIKATLTAGGHARITETEVLRFAGIAETDETDETETETDDETETETIAETDEG